MVTDFGLSDYEEELSSESPVCGTATYLAPEVQGRVKDSLKHPGLKPRSPRDF